MKNSSLSASFPQQNVSHARIFTAPSFGGAVFDIENAIEKLLEGELMNQKISIPSCLIAFFSAGFLAFGMYNIHAVAHVTEGGVLGAVLLIQHWLHISPAFSSLLLNGLCYLLGWRTFGKPFVAYSAAAAAGYSLFYYGH